MTRPTPAHALLSVAKHAVRASLIVPMVALKQAAKRVPTPEPRPLPVGRMVDLPGRGRTYVADVPGPTDDAPVLVLLHGLACTAALNWFTVVDDLSARYRVVTFDQRWHGRGIRSPRFSIEDCADDVVAVLDALEVRSAVVAGYSLGGFVAQETWHRHPERVDGLVLCSTARNSRGLPRERYFFPVLSAAMLPLSRYAAVRVERVGSGLPETPAELADDLRTWGRAEFRSTSAWALPEVVRAVGAFNSAAWIGDVDVPTAVVVTDRDKSIPVRRQRKLVDAIDGAREFTAPGGHASIFFDSPRWAPVFTEAVAWVADRCPQPSRSAG